MDVSSCIDSFDLVVTLVRSAPGAYDAHGRYAAGAIEELERRMVVAPATPRDLQVLPEGLRSEETLVFYCKNELRGAGAGDNAAPADRVFHLGSTYELQHIEDWSLQGGFWRAIGTRVEQ